MLVVDALIQIDNRKRMVKNWFTAEAVCQSLKAKYPHIISRLSIGWEYGFLNGILVFIENGKDGKWLKNIFNFLGKHGYIHKGKPEISGELNRITWDFGDIKVSAFFREGSDSCKFIKKEINSYEYKFVCPEMNLQ
jgi:hypothetical protein